MKADQLFNVFSECGLIREIRLMYEFNQQNRGFCFIAYTNEEDATRAIQTLHDSPRIHQECGKYGAKDKIGIKVSRKQKRLFLGGIGKEKFTEEIKSAVFEELRDTRDIKLEIEHIDVIKKS